MRRAANGSRGSILWRGVLAVLLLCRLVVAADRPGPQTGTPHILLLATFRDRLRGGWAGQMIGVSYGSVYEFRSLGEPITGPLRAWKPAYVENSLGQDDLY